MHIFLMLPGSPIPDWLLLLTPLVLLVIVVKCCQWLYRLYQRKYARHHRPLSEGDNEPQA